MANILQVIDKNTDVAGPSGLTGVRAVCGRGPVSPPGRVALSLQHHQKIPPGKTDSDSRESNMSISRLAATKCNKYVNSSVVTRSLYGK